MLREIASLPSRAGAVLRQMTSRKMTQNICARPDFCAVPPRLALLRVVDLAYRLLVLR
jgi:hypothetical protein